MKDDINDTARREGIDAVRRRSDAAERFGGPTSGKDRVERKDPIVVQLNGAHGKPIEPLVLVQANSFEGQPIPEREWLVGGRIPVANVSLLGGDGAVGKTLLALMLSVAVVRKIDWLGAPVVKQGRVIFFTAEEDKDELHRRLDAIIAHEGIRFSDLNDLHLYCCPGEDGTLGRATRSSPVLKKTPLFDQLYLSATTIKPALIVIETAADVFGGNEIDRSHVRQFIALLRRLARDSGAAVLLLAHPSVAGKASGDGTSGSTGWNNSVRSRMYFEIMKKEDTREDDIRELKVMKANYARKGEVVRVRWERGVFVLHGDLPPREQLVENAKIDEIFLTCLDIKTAQGLGVGPNPSSNYAPTKFATMTEAQGLSPEALKKAMERLHRNKRIKFEKGPRGGNVIVRDQQVLKLIEGGKDE
jgi:RecA-family ATPase